MSVPPPQTRKVSADSYSNRLVEDMADKLGAYEYTLRRIKPELGNDDQSEISQLLLTVPSPGAMTSAKLTQIPVSSE